MRQFKSIYGDKIVTRTNLSFAFYDPCRADSPYSPPHGMPLDEATRLLLTGELPFKNGTYSPVFQSPSRTPPPSPSSPGSTLSVDPAPTSPISLDSGSDDGLDSMKCCCPEAVRFDDVAPERRPRHKAHITERWYTVTRGLRVGPVQGL